MNAIALSFVGTALLVAALWINRRTRKSRLNRKESADS
jgi:LPXTG-motif cell wall-anchored protein